MYQCLSDWIGTDDFPARWTCGDWSATHGWIHILADLATFGAYTAIPCVLAYFIFKRRDMPFPRIFWLFCAFIFACGTVHLIEAIIFWWPIYRVSAGVKVATALVSWATVIALIPVVPQALALPGEARRRERLQREVAERRRAEEELNAVVNGVIDAIIAIDERGVIQSFNTAAEHIFGYTRDEAIGQRVNMLMPTHYAEHHDGYLNNYLEGGEPRIIGIGRQVEGQRKDGTIFPMDLAVSELDVEGRRMFVGIARDISERVAFEESLRRANDELERKNQEMEQFVYSASHDLKSPIVTIVGFTGILRRAIEAGEHDRLLEHVGHLEVACSKMRRSIDELLELSRIGTVPNNPAPVDTGELARQVVAEQSQNKQHQAEFRVDPDMPTVVADRGRLTHVFDNLVGNALKYGRDTDDLRIEIGADTTPAEIRFYVRDNGPGIDAEFHRKIFEMFQRLDVAIDGTGMGLAIVNRVAETHGGRAWVESELGEGATFWVALPRDGQGTTP